MNIFVYDIVIFVITYITISLCNIVYPNIDCFKKKKIIISHFFKFCGIFIFLLYDKQLILPYSRNYYF